MSILVLQRPKQKLPSNYQHEVYFKYMILWLYSEYATIALAGIKASTITSVPGWIGLLGILGHRLRPLRWFRPRSKKGPGLACTCRLIPCSFFGYPILVLGIYNHKLGYPKKEHGMGLQVEVELQVANIIGSHGQNSLIRA